MAELMQAHREWAKRPKDERFLDLTEMLEVQEGLRYRSKEMVLERTALSFVADGPNGLKVVGPKGNGVDLTHWSFGQMAGLAGAPAGYMRNLPAPLAAQCLNHGLKSGEADKAQFLLTKMEGGPSAPVQLRAANGPTYGRIWNEEITRTLIRKVGDGRTGQFKVPGEFGKQVEITRDNTTLYAGDRDMFVFLADEEHRIEVPNRRNGKSGSLARGFMISNSEVGAGKLWLAMFLFDFVCANRIIWGAEGFKEVSIRHTSGAPDRWLGEVYPAIIEAANASAAAPQRVIANAMQMGVGDRLDGLLTDFFGTKKVAEAIKVAHIEDEARPIESIWDITVGATAYARALPWQDERVNVERAAGRVLQLAA